MAIKKIKELSNGTQGEYWVAQASNNMVSKQTDVLMLLFKDKASRDEGKTFLLRERVPSIDGIYLTGEQVYAGVKASRMSEANEETESVETNWFADAEDI
jgi:sulfur transfer complex TusBCD TusB component (DsrH family)